MSKFEKTFRFRTRTLIEVDIFVQGNDELEATLRYQRGSWKSVSPPDWDKVINWNPSSPPVEIKE